jgi:glycosyltransferase involved in cell wall biosynthesis
VVGRRGKPPLVLIIVQNLPLPGDRRVWLECQTLRDAGYRVAAITPKAPGDPTHAELAGVQLYKYRPAPAALGPIGYVYEFLYCWLATLVLALRVVAGHGMPAAIQACNPPDTYWALALLFKPFGVKFVFDQHDLCPEVYESRFGRRDVLYRGTALLEQATYRTADHVIATNESYKRVAHDRGRLPADRVTVVRTGPDSDLLRAREPRPELRRGRRYLVHFHGVMGPQDSVDIVIRTVANFLSCGRTDTFFNVMGGGDMYDSVRALADELGVTDYVYLPGRVSDDELFDSMSTADVGLAPDLPNPLNNVSTMNKTMEYMAFGLPSVSFDLPETRVSAEDASEYVADPSPEAFAKAVMALLDNPERRAEMSEFGVRRARTALAWPIQAVAYRGVYGRLVGEPRPAPTAAVSDR